MRINRRRNLYIYWE